MSFNGCPSELTDVKEIAVEAFLDLCFTGDLARSDKTGRDQQAHPSHAKKAAQPVCTDALGLGNSPPGVKRPVLLRRPSNEPLTLGNVPK